ncbi:PREDICTED: NACHT and WD repeat domain-containing protein 2 isoform X1 [Nicrophorus vespilloides]|uniref:NACHT and WD repeat domain-containing protein 2 isoform X1 n=1 Tax=Nicrophorus vespilloides TaxID=110193 RepID=A0ABM1MLN5_NICVS|nr:PREDICTED: NACHT and WD repeat domain-containing protein 2 isoform X1 [Nicrophorus vespilloides]
MGNSCSSGQGHKDKDNMSQRSEESGSYQIRASLPSDKQQVLMNHVTHTGGVLLEPSTAGQQAIQQVSNATTPSTGNEKKVPSKILRGIAAPSVSDSLSLSSPPGIVSPRDLIIDGNVPPELASLSEQLQNLLMGKVSFAKTASKTRKIVIYVCAADSQDCCVEKGALHNALYPELRARCRLKGYELHIVDLHWKTLLEKQQDHEFPELCIGELTRQMEVAYVIPVLFLNNSLGTPLLPISIECSDFQMAMNSVEDQSAQSLLSKWYKLDEAAQPPCYRLQSTSSHIPGFKETSTEDREKALEEWQSEIERMLVVLINVFSQELRDTYLTTVVEQEVHNTVFMSQELAKRCIWINRVYTPGEKTTNEPPSPGESEHFRRLNILQRDLRNQLAEKHIVRLPVKYVDGGLNMEIPEHAQYISQVLGHMNKHLTEMIDAIIDEHQSKNILKPSYGIDTSIFEELNQQTTFCQKAAQCSVNREKTISDIKNYILTENHSPLVIYGPGGCGKTTLLARIAQCTSQWLPESFLVLRFVGISAQSSTIEQLLSSITHQCSILTYGHKSSVAHTIDNYKNALPNLLMASCMQRPLIVVLDGIEQVKMYSSKVIDWLPLQLPDNIKLIISVSENSDIYKDMVKVIPEESFIRMPVLGELEAKGILMSSVMQYNHSVNSKIQDCVLKSVQECTLPLYTKVLAWQTSWWADKENVIVPKGQVDDQLTLMLEELETILGQNQVEHALAIMTSTKHGITDSEMLDLLAHDEIFQNNTTYVSWAPACLAWSRLNKHLAPFLQWTLTGTVLGVQWRDNMLLQAVKKRYKSYSNWAHEMLFNYYNGKWWSEQPQANLSARLISQDTLLGTCYNRRKLDELPYHYYYLHGSEKLSSSDYLNDLNWIYDKVCGSNCFQLLEDIHLCKQEGISLNESVAVLQSFLETYVNVLNYDGRQFYSQFYSFLSMLQPKGEDICSDIFSICKDPPIPSLIPNYCLDIAVEDEHATKRRKAYDLIVRLPETHQFVACISTEDEQISVWNAARWERVRLLKGIPHPTNLVPINQHKCIVLCQRELRIYDLNTGTFLTKLKGVMNQKMPYYGLHDASHLVALSRNRMYVNLMNLETGDCVTTFKAGEDRFLNSLLVSGDGRVLVCGDETQKPFPLLVWNLQSRKLLYDLRIPHHDFITSLSAITYEGNYVCCVCHEIDEPNPNFIVVYDLQSGTLFKKWKPSCDTVSLEISSQGGCVISGLEDARILVWDLITGNCRWTLEGHTAPVNYLRLEPRGVLFLSTDIQGRDKSIRVWDLNKGNLVAVYTTSLNITTCDMSLQGQTIILSMEGCEELVFLKLRGPGVEETIEELEVPYGDPEIDFAEFDLSESGAC